jgi:hypothetical protein
MRDKEGYKLNGFLNKYSLSRKVLTIPCFGLRHDDCKNYIE